METQCNRQKVLFEAHGRREVRAAFDGGRITSDAGGLLLREAEQRFGIVRSFVDAFTDYRSSDASEFSVSERLRQRVMGIAPGYKDLNDHEQLRHDPLLVLIVGRSSSTGENRADERSKGVPSAGKSDRWQASTGIETVRRVAAHRTRPQQSVRLIGIDPQSF